MKQNQVFIRGPELKADLAKLDVHYSALQEDMKERGVMSFARYPPAEGDFLTSGLWGRLMAPQWRERARRPAKILSAETRKQLIAQMDRIKSAPRAGGREAQFGSREADAVVFKRRVPIRKGKWRLLPPEVEAETPEV